MASACGRIRSSASATGWGAFGGKESQAAHPALLAAMVATRRAAGAGRLPAGCGHARHGQTASIPVPLQGRLRRRRADRRTRARAVLGCRLAADLSLAVMERSMLHADNAYFIPNLVVSGTVCRTNHPSNTAMRGFGGPQGIAAVENVIEEVAAYLGLDPLEVRRRNLYGVAGRDTTHYGQVVAEQQAAELLDRLAATRITIAGAGRRPDSTRVADAPPRPRPDAGQVRHLLHAPDAQPGRRPGQHLPRRHGAGLDGRHRDGPGAQYQDRSDRRRRVRDPDRGCPGDAGLDREDPQHLADGRLGDHRPERHRGAPGVRDAPGAARRGGRGAPRVDGGWHRALAGPRSLRSRRRVRRPPARPIDRLLRARQAGL